MENEKKSILIGFNDFELKTLIDALNLYYYNYSFITKGSCWADIFFKDLINRLEFFKND